MAYTIPSQYQPAWNKLKREGKIRLLAPPELHERIWNAIRKRKNRDLGFKLQNAEKFREAVLSRTSEANVLVITLEFKYNLAYTGAY